MILYLEYKYMDIVHNNSKHISNVVVHILIMDMQFCLPYSCQILFWIVVHNVHVFIFQVNNHISTIPMSDQQ